MNFIKKHWRLILPILLLAIIFFFSAEGSTASDATSESVANFFGIPNAIMRKIAHFILYAALGASLNYYFRTLGKFTSAFNFVVSLGLATFFATFDELHQTFVPGRAGLLSDVLLDTAAAATGIILFASIYYLTRSKTQKQSRREQEAKIWQNNDKLLKKIRKTKK